MYTQLKHLRAGAACAIRQRELGMRFSSKLRPMPHVYRHFRPVSNLQHDKGIT